MRKKNQEICDPETIQTILKTSRICRIAMVDGDVPYILPFNYGFADNHIYIHSAPEGKKIDLLRKNARVCFEIEDHIEIIEADKACDWTTKYRSIIGYGTMEIITDPIQKRQGLDIIMLHYGDKKNHVYDDKNVNRMVILRLKIEQMTGKQSSNWE